MAARYALVYRLNFNEAFNDTRTIFHPLAFVADEDLSNGHSGASASQN
jgi:hypothetical protein